MNCPYKYIPASGRLVERSAVVRPRDRESGSDVIMVVVGGRADELN